MADIITFTYLFVVDGDEEWRLESIEGWGEDNALVGRLTRVVVKQAQEKGLLDASGTDEYTMYVKVPPGATLTDLGIKSGDTVIIARANPKLAKDIGGLGEPPSSSSR